MKPWVVSISYIIQSDIQELDTSHHTWSTVHRAELAIFNFPSGKTEPAEPAENDTRAKDVNFFDSTPSRGGEVLNFVLLFGKVRTSKTISAPPLGLTLLWLRNSLDFCAISKLFVISVYLQRLFTLCTYDFSLNLETIWANVLITSKTNEELRAFLFPIKSKSIVHSR